MLKHNGKEMITHLRINNNPADDNALKCNLPVSSVWSTTLDPSKVTCKRCLKKMEKKP